MHNIFKDANGEYVVFDYSYRKAFPTYGEAVQHLNELIYVFEVVRNSEGKFEVYEVWLNLLRDLIGSFDNHEQALQCVRAQRIKRNQSITDT